MAIIKLTIDHYNQIIELWRLAELPIKIYGRDSYSALKKQINSNIITLLGEEDDKGHLIGVILLTNDGRKGWINRLAVHPNYQRKGVAMRLLKAAEEFFDKHEIEVIGALIFSNNNPSIKFFEKAGFELAKEIQYYSKRRNIES